MSVLKNMQSTVIKNTVGLKGEIVELKDVVEIKDNSGNTQINSAYELKVFVKPDFVTINNVNYKVEYQAFNGRVIINDSVLYIYEMTEDEKFLQICQWEDEVAGNEQQYC
tara:strand:- start:130 stop:459 length:330 start_codon:yes stop_codon:yes gene_type:complete